MEEADIPSKTIGTIFIDQLMKKLFDDRLQ